jgi:trimeric autotransporter adhesin
MIARNATPQRDYSKTAPIVVLVASLLILGSCGGSTQEVPKLTSISVVPALTFSANVEVGEQTKMVAQGRYSDNTYVDVTEAAAWMSSDSAIASVDKNTITGISAGTAQIRATLGGITAERSINIAPGVVSLEIQPGGPFSISATQQQQFHAIATYTDGTVAEVSGGWSVSPKGVLGFDLLLEGGNAYFLAPGTATITVTYAHGFHNGIHTTAILSVEVLP